MHFIIAWLDFIVISHDSWIRSWHIRARMCVLIWLNLNGANSSCRIEFIVWSWIIYAQLHIYFLHNSSLPRRLCYVLLCVNSSLQCSRNIFYLHARHSIFFSYKNRVASRDTHLKNKKSQICLRLNNFYATPIEITFVAVCTSCRRDRVSIETAAELNEKKIIQSRIQLKEFV